MLPTTRSCSPLRAATTVVTNSGREVPNAITVNEINLSLQPIAVAIAVQFCTTISLPIIIPANPSNTKSSDLPSFISGFSSLTLFSLLCRANVIK